MQTINLLSLAALSNNWSSSCGEKSPVAYTPWRSNNETMGGVEHFHLVQIFKDEIQDRLVYKRPAKTQDLQLGEICDD